MADTETVTLRLPSGEEIDAVVPAGMSDAEIKVYTLSKRPDLFTSQAKAPTKESPGAAQPLPGLAGAAKPSSPELQSSVPYSGPFGELAAGLLYDPEFRNETGKYAAASAAVTGAAAAAPSAAAAALPTAIRGAKWLGAWAAKPQNAVYAYIIYKELESHFGKAVRFIKGAPNVEPGQ